MISLIIPNYNKVTHIRETLDSAIAQSAVSQIIVVDDASTDGSLGLVRSAAARDSRIEVVCMDRNRNASFCRNRGLERAHGTYVIFLDSDDLLAPHCSQLRLEFAERHPSHDLWVFPMRVFRDSPSRPLDTWAPRSGDHLRRFLAHRIDWQTMQPLWRREFLERIGGFDDSFTRLQDPEMHVRALLAGARVKCFPEVEPDCSYRAFADDAGDATRLSMRSVESTLHFYRTFYGKLPACYRNDLTGTLFASVAQHFHWRTRGQLGVDACNSAIRKLIAACENPTQRRVLSLYAAMRRRMPVHVPGVNRVTRLLLGIPV